MANKKARTSMEETHATATRMEEKEDDNSSSYDDYDEDDYDSDASDYDSDDDEEELKAFQLLSEQIQEAKRANQLLKQTLVATVGDKKKDNSSMELVASLMAGRKHGAVSTNGQAGAPSSSLARDKKPAAENGK